MTSPRPGGGTEGRDEQPETPEQGRGEAAATTSRPPAPADRGHEGLERR